MEEFDGEELMEMLETWIKTAGTAQAPKFGTFYINRYAVHKTIQPKDYEC